MLGPRITRSVARIYTVVNTFSSDIPAGPPGKPYLVVTSPTNEPDVITVRWKPPAYDGGSEIRGKELRERVGKGQVL